MSDLRILFLTEDNLNTQRSGAVRIYPLSKELEKHGVKSEIVSPSHIHFHNPLRKHLLRHDLKNYLKLITTRENFDVLYVSRISSLTVLLIQKLWKKSGKKVIFDLDDPLFLRSNPLFFLKGRALLYLDIERVTINSDAVIVSSHYIMRYTKSLNEKSYLIHTPVSTKVFHPKKRKEHDKITIGWVGVAPGHLPNLKMLVNPLLKLGKEYDLNFKIISYLGEQKVKKLFRPLETFMGVDYGFEHFIPYDNLPDVMSDVDIFVAPLQPTPLNIGKSVIRIAMAMAMGLPVIVSPLSEYQHFIKNDVNGLFAKNEKEWISNLRLLIQDDDLRKRIGKEGRKSVEKEASLEVCGKKLLEIIQLLD